MARRRSSSPSRCGRFSLSSAAPLRALGLLLPVFGALGCHPALDMATAYDAARPALTIPYTGVREELRQYPDYGSIGGSILVDEPAPPPTGKGSAPRKGKP
ncbi:MAG: hypothetical protein U0359_40960 [Byssovorax sp.]